MERAFVSTIEALGTPDTQLQSWGKFYAIKVFLKRYIFWAISAWSGDLWHPWLCSNADRWFHPHPHAL